MENAGALPFDRYGLMTRLAPCGSTPRILLYTAIYGFASTFYPSYSSAYTNTAARPLRRFLNESYVLRGHAEGLPHMEATWLWSLLLNANIFGHFVGTPFVPLANDYLGRRPALLIGTGLQLLASCLDLLAILVHGPELYFVSRMLGNGSNMIVWGSFILIAVESAPIKLRGTCTFIFGTVWSAGMVIGMVLGMGTVLGERLPLLTGAGILPSLVAFLMAMPLRETPKFLLSANLKTNAAVMKAAQHEKVLCSLYFYQGLRGEEANKAAQETLDELRKEAFSNASGTAISFSQKLGELWNQVHLRRALLLAYCALQLTIGVYPITTQLLAVHFGQAQAQFFVSTLMATSFVASIAGATIVHRMRQRVQLLGSGLGNLCALLTYIACDRLAEASRGANHSQLSLAFSWGCLLAMLCYYVTFGIGIGTIAFYLGSELLPQSYRSLGQSLAFFLALLSIFLFNLVTLPLYEMWDVWVFLPTFALPQTLCLVYMWRRLPETRNRKVHAIVAELMKK